MLSITFKTCRGILSNLSRTKKLASFLSSCNYSSSLVPLENTNIQEFRDDKIDVPKYFAPTFNFAAYVNKSETLRKFVELGVDLSNIEKRKGLPQFVLKLDFDRDVKSHLFFLHDLGLPPETFGYFITKNPLIFKESIDDLETRVYYLRSKNFSIEQVREIVSKNPYWLSFTTRRIDRRLGYFQKNFQLTGNEIRSLCIMSPRLITYNMEHIREATFSIKEEMGFDKDEIKCLLLTKPRLWMLNRDELVERFDYAHNKMKLNHDKILQTPEVLFSRTQRLKERHEFLKLLGKDQYDETKPLYISPKAIVEGTDADFVLKVCDSSPETYDNFLKTL